MRHCPGLPLIAAVLLLATCCPMATSAVSPQNSPELPVLTDPAFIAKIQVVIQDKGETMFAIEKYDETKNKSSVTMINGDQASMFIFDYAAQAVFDVTYSLSTKTSSSCVAISMNKADSTEKYGLKDNFHFFGGWRPANSKTIPHMFSSKDIFTLGTKKSIVYMGTEKIDGILADKWTTKMSWPEGKVSFDVFYYFTHSAWAPAESSERDRVYPLRIKISGQKQDKSGSYSDLLHYYEYLDFVTSKRLPEDAFDIPVGSYCGDIGKIPEKSLPSIPDVLSYSKEVVDSRGNVAVSHVAYDKTMKAMRITSGKGLILYDFNFGVRYQIASRCIIRAIDPDQDANSKQSGEFATDIGPSEFYLLNQTFVYFGVSHTRSIDANMFGGSLDNDAFDVYFGKADWQYPQNKYRTPLTMDRDGKHYNFFHFKASAPGLRTDPIWGSCNYGRERQHTVKIIFYTKSYVFDNDFLTDDNIALLADAIAKEAWLTKPQVQIFSRASHFDKATKRLTIATRFLPGPSPEHMYKRKDNLTIVGAHLKPKIQKLPKADYDSIIKTSADICETTASTTNFICRNFDLCSNADGSYTMKMYQALTVHQAIGVSESTTCNHFARSVNGNGPTPLTTALSNLKDSITKGFLRVSLKRTVRSDIDMTGTEMESELQYRNIMDDKRSSLGKFSIMYPPQNLKTTETITAKTAEDCARNCLSRGHYQCRGFSMCYSTSQCLLTSDRPSKSKQNKMNIGACIAFKRNYIADFKAMPGLVMQYNSKDVYQDIAQPNDCAAKCSENKDYNCESFNYCTDTKECLLSKTHVYSTTAGSVKNQTTACTHYSKNYLLDFDRSGNTALTSDDKHGLEAFQVSSPEQCAFLCHTGYGEKDCVQFDYCSDTNLCHIAGSELKSYVGHVPKANCDTFTITDVQKVVSSGKLTGSTETTYSDASFGGLAFAMVVLGLAIGAGILFVLHRQRILSRFIG